MCSEDLDCGICYEPYNAARRCPRELQCVHSFCESCLVALCPGDSIACPLCRRITHVPGGADAGVRAALRVDEGVLERMLSAGVPLDDVTAAGDHADDDGEGRDDRTPNAGSLEEGSDASLGSRDGRLGKALRKMWGKLIGSKRRGDRARNCMTDEEFRDFAMMSFYTF